MRTLWLSLLLLFAAVPALAEERDHSERLMFLMRLIDQVPTKAQMIEAGAGEKGEALIAIAKDTTLPRYPRMRAAGALGLFDSNEARSALGSIIDEGDDVEVKIQALVALVHLEGLNARPRLSSLLLHSNLELRAAASRQLQSLVRKGL